jgi:hypothetical protein
VTDHIYLGRVADTLADGRPLGFGDEVSLDQDAENANQHLIDAGVLAPRPVPAGDVLTGDALKARAAELEIEGRSAMNAEQLRAAIAAAESNQETTQ